MCSVVNHIGLLGLVRSHAPPDDYYCPPDNKVLIVDAQKTVLHDVPFQDD